MPRPIHRVMASRGLESVPVAAHRLGVDARTFRRWVRFEVSHGLRAESFGERGVTLLSPIASDAVARRRYVELPALASFETIESAAERLAVSARSIRSRVYSELPDHFVDEWISRGVRLKFSSHAFDVIASKMRGRQAA